MKKIGYSCIGLMMMLMLSGCDGIRADKDYIGYIEDIETTKEFEEQINEEDLNTHEIHDVDYAVLEEQKDVHNDIMYHYGDGCKICKGGETGRSEGECMYIDLKEHKYDGDRGIGYCRERGLYRYERKPKEERVNKDDEFTCYDYYSGSKIE